MLQLNEIAKHYNGQYALYPFSLSVPEGKTTVLIGPSGCGKSTVLRLIAGLIKADTGSILLQGEKLTNDTILQLRHRMGYVIQHGGLFPHLTCTKNISLLVRHLQWNNNTINARINELLGLLRIPRELLSRYPAELSGGQQQRISLMRALMPNPDLLLLDEPMAALDPMIRNELQQELREIFRKLHKTVLLVTHDMAEAGYLGDLIVLLREGRLIQQGSLQQLLKTPADPFVYEFIQAQSELWSEFQQQVE